MVIHDRFDLAIYSYNRPESLQDMHTTRDMCNRSLHVLHEQQRIGQPVVPVAPPPILPAVPAAPPPMPPTFPVHPPPFTSSSQTSSSYVTPTMPSYTYHTSSHDMPSSSRPSISGVIPRRTTHRHITSPVAYDQCSSFSPVGDDDEFDGYVDPLLASWGQIETPISVEGQLSLPDRPSHMTEGVSQITQAESQRQQQIKPQPETQPGPEPHRLGTITRVTRVLSC